MRGRTEREPSLTVIRGLSIIAICIVCFGIAGALLGVTLGIGAPAYYRGTFRAGDNPAFNPVQVGLGLGISQGLACGVVIGCVVVLASSRPRKGESVESSADLASGRSQSTLRRVLVPLTILAGIASGGIVGFVTGAIIGQLELYQQSTDAKFAKIRPVLRGQFSEVKAANSSAAQVYLMGTVDSDQAYKTLEERMRFLFGDEEARFMMLSVEVVRK